MRQGGELRDVFECIMAAWQQCKGTITPDDVSSVPPPP